MKLFARADGVRTGAEAALVAQKELPSLAISVIPPELAVGADYGTTLLVGAPASADGFAAYILSPEGRRIIGKHGFALP